MDTQKPPAPPIKLVDHRRTEPQGCLAGLLFFGVLGIGVFVVIWLLGLLGFRTEEEREQMKTHPAVRAGAWLVALAILLSLLRLVLETLQLVVWFIDWARTVGAGA